jgi:hypothetical protein
LESISSRLQTTPKSVWIERPKRLNKRNEAPPRRCAGPFGLVSDGATIELSPNGESVFNFYAPPSQWYRWDFYDTARECWDVDHDLFVRSQSILRINPLDDAANADLEAQCIATDDPRLEN